MRHFRNDRGWHIWLTCLVAIASVSSTQAAETSVSFELNAGETPRTDCPIWLELPESLDAAEHLELIGPSGEAIPCQTSEDGTQLVFILNQPLGAKETRQYKIRSAKQGPASAVQSSTDGDFIHLAIGDKRILTYNAAAQEPPEGASELYRRSGHIHPFITPSGRVVTDEFPSDHYHQHAIFAAWTKTFFAGERVDFWNQMANTGTVGHAKILRTVSGPVYASFQVELVHHVLKDSPLEVLKEAWNVRLYNTQNMHLFDLESVQTCVAETPLTIAEYHYGGFAYRGSAEWIKNDKHKIITNETRDRKIGNHTRPNWVSIYGPVKGSFCGAAMFSHPENFRSPQPVRLHPSMPYFVYSPCVLGEFDLKPGEPFTTKCRYLSYDGPPDHAELDNAWQAYSDPPQISWINKSR